MECFEWDAWYNRMPGAGDTDLHVTGKCRLESSSFELSLAPGNEGIVDEPDLFVLTLEVRRPPAGDDRMDEREVTWRGDAGQGIKRVRIQGEASAHIDVREVQ